LAVAQDLDQLFLKDLIAVDPAAAQAQVVYQPQVLVLPDREMQAVPEQVMCGKVAVVVVLAVLAEAVVEPEAPGLTAQPEQVVVVQVEINGKAAAQLDMLGDLVVVVLEVIEHQYLLKSTE
jgi:hypothetical protein